MPLRAPFLIAAGVSVAVIALLARGEPNDALVPPTPSVECVDSAVPRRPEDVPDTSATRSRLVARVAPRVRPLPDGDAARGRDDCDVMILAWRPVVVEAPP